MPETKVAIIGAGPSGLVTARWALANSLTPVIFEQHAELGGLWHPKTGGMWNSMRTNVSKFTCSFSDLPWPDEAPMFPNANEMYAYLQRYAQMFNLEQYIQFNTEVKLVDLVNNCWQVIVQQERGEPIALVFDNVIVASGSFEHPYIPKIQGLSSYSAEPGQIVMHSHNYKDMQPESMQGKKVTIVGSGFSATEIAAEIANYAVVQQVFRKPHWVMPRYIPMPLDLGLISNQRHARKTDEEVRIKTPEQNQRANAYLANFCPEQTNPAHPLYISPDSCDPPFVSISDSYMGEVAKGNIHIVAGEIRRFTRHGYLLHNSDETQHADVVIFATGFRTPMSFLTERVRKALQHDSKDTLQNALLFAGAMHPELPGFACIGTDRGPYPAKMEMVARYVTMLLSGKLPKPPDATMRAWIKQEQITRMAKPRVQFPHADYVGFNNELARCMGCDPMQGDFAQSDPDLHHRLLHTTVTAADYRLRGLDANPMLYSRQAAQIGCALAPYKLAPQHNASTSALQRGISTLIRKLPRI